MSSGNEFSPELALKLQSVSNKKQGENIGKLENIYHEVITKDTKARHKRKAS